MHQAAPRSVSRGRPPRLGPAVRGRVPGRSHARREAPTTAGHRAPARRTSNPSSPLIPGGFATGRHRSQVRSARALAGPPGLLAAATAWRAATASRTHRAIVPALAGRVMRQTKAVAPSDWRALHCAAWSTRPCGHTHQSRRSAREERGTVRLMWPTIKIVMSPCRIAMKALLPGFGGGGLPLGVVLRQRGERAGLRRVVAGRHHHLAGIGTAALPLGSGGQRSVRNWTGTLARGRETARYAVQGVGSRELTPSRTARR